MPYGDSYQRFLTMPAQPDDPFPHPINDAQRIENARARAARAGAPIGSGYLNPRSGRLEDPDAGIGKYLPIIGPLAVGGTALGLTALGGLGAAGASGGAAGGGGTAGGLLPSSHLPTAALMGGPAAITSHGVSAGIPIAARTGGGPLGALGRGAKTIGGKIVNGLTSKEGIGSIASIITALMALKGGGPFGGGDGKDRGMDLAENAYADAQRLNAMREARFRRVDPLHEAVTQLAFNRMPTTNATNGIDLTRVPLPK